MEKSDDNLVWSVKRTASELGLCLPKVYEMIERGEIPSLRCGRRILVPVARLKEFINGNGGGPKASESCP